MSNLPTQCNATTVQEYLAKLAPAATQKAAEQRAGRGRLIFALDATASREATWDQACRIQGEMFSATAGIGALDLQLVFYRGFNECKSTRWMTSAGELHRVMTGVRCVGGITQIERILSHAIRETGKCKVNALIFVGDAMEENVDALGRHAGELGRLGVPVFVLHEGNDLTATNAFRQIASLSGGAYLPFDLAGIDRLRQLLAAIAVYATAGYAALAAYGQRQGQGGAAVLQLTAQLKR